MSEDPPPVNFICRKQDDHEFEEIFDEENKYVKKKCKRCGHIETEIPQGNI